MHDINASSVLLLPCVRIREELKQNFSNFGFLGTYTLCENLTYHFYPLYLLFKPEKFGIEFYQFSQQLERNQNFIETLDLPEGLVLFVFKIPTRLEEDFELIKQNRFKSFSPEFKSCFPMTRFIFNEFGGVKKDSSTGRPISAPTGYAKLFNGTLLDVDSYKYSEEKETLRW